jgi:hypothetical protein
MEIDPRAGAALDLRVNSTAVLSSIKWQFGSLAPVEVPLKNAKAGEYRQEIVVPAGLDSGLARLEIKARDVRGQETVWEEYFYIVEAGGRRSAASGFQWVRSKSNADGRILVSPAGEPLLGLSAGPAPRSVSMSGSGADNFAVSVDGMGRVTLKAQREGEYGPFNLELTDSSGGTYQAGPFRFLVGFAAPSISVTGGMDGKWARDNVAVQFTVSGANRINAAEYSVDLGGGWVTMI